MATRTHPPIEPGQSYGTWLVIQKDTTKANGRWRYAWVCRCQCGIEKSVTGTSLIQGASLTCNQCRNKRNQTLALVHGANKSPSHRCWVSMRARVNNPKNKAYRYYGGRGITICPRWSSFSAFLSDMGERPSELHSIDRINVNGDYEPGNCRWATDVEQANNTRANIRFIHDGHDLTLTQWCRKLGLNPSMVRQRVRKGWEIAKALGLS